MNNKKEIVDLTGKPFNKDDGSKVEKLKKYISENIWNILGIGIGACITIGSLINIFVSTYYARDCSQYYGIDVKYFDGSTIFRDKIIFLVIAIILILYPIFFNYLNRKLESKVYVIASFVVMVCLLFMQNLVYTVNLINLIRSEWLITIIDNYVTLIVFLIADIILGYFFILRRYLKNDKLLSRVEKLVFSFVLGIYLIDSVIGISIGLNRQISDKKDYEVIDNNKVVITTYEGKFLVMDCDVQEEVLYIKKGEYAFIEMSDVSIKYHEYKDVKFE